MGAQDNAAISFVIYFISGSFGSCFLESTCPYQITVRFFFFFYLISETNQKSLKTRNGLLGQSDLGSVLTVFHIVETLRR